MRNNVLSKKTCFRLLLILSSVDRLLVPANRDRLSQDEQLQQLLEKFDLTCAMKSSPSRSKRLKLLKKTINDVRNEISLKRVLPSHHHSSSSTAPSTSASSSSAASHPELAKPKEERLKPNGHFPDDEGTYGSVLALVESFLFDAMLGKLPLSLSRESHVLNILKRRSEARD